MVLEARENAKSVWFPIVWENEKDASNVINYNINEEITKDKTAVINANNDTTTGMAWVVPWINSPKLIAKTSILWDLWWGWGSSWARIIEVSDYVSIDERQPVVDAILWWEFVIVHCKFKSYSTQRSFYFIPCEYKAWDAMIFYSIYPRTKWFSISCNVTMWVITSITTANWTP
jgi:hypothetical protein